MMQHEFETLAGYKVSSVDYKNIIEPMYMALPDSIGKEEFVKMLDMKRFALPSKRTLLCKMRNYARWIAEDAEHNYNRELREKLDRLAKQYAKLIHGLDWDSDRKVYAFFNVEYTGPNMRGCSYPVELVIGHEDIGEFERIKLIDRKVK